MAEFEVDVFERISVFHWKIMTMSSYEYMIKFSVFDFWIVFNNLIN